MTNTPLSLVQSTASDEPGYRFIALTAQQNAPLAALIRAVSAEYGLTADKGFSVADPQLDRLSQCYQAQGSGYWLLEDGKGQLLGGAGWGPVPGHAEVCELQKMYLAASACGQGLGRQLALKVLQGARAHGYRQCYLETTALLPEALTLYRKLGFSACPRLGNTGHHDCEITLMRSL